MMFIVCFLAGSCGMDSTEQADAQVAVQYNPGFGGPFPPLPNGGYSCYQQAMTVDNQGLVTAFFFCLNGRDSHIEATERRLEQEDLQALRKAVFDANVFSLKDDYRGPVPVADCGTESVAVYINGRAKNIILDCLGDTTPAKFRYMIDSLRSIFPIR
jgi:hypothetical protein